MKNIMIFTKDIIDILGKSLKFLYYLIKILKAAQE